MASKKVDLTTLSADEIKELNALKGEIIADPAFKDKIAPARKKYSTYDSQGHDMGYDEKIHKKYSPKTLARAGSKIPYIKDIVSVRDYIREFRTRIYSLLGEGKLDKKTATEYLVACDVALREIDFHSRRARILSKAAKEASLDFSVDGVANGDITELRTTAKELGKNEKQRVRETKKATNLGMLAHGKIAGKRVKDRISKRAGDMIRVARELEPYPRTSRQEDLDKRWQLVTEGINVLFGHAELVDKEI